MSETSEIPTEIEPQKTENPNILHEIRYLKGEEQKIAFLPIFDNLPVKNVFSWGREAKTMSYKYNNGESGEDIKGRIEKFLSASGIKYPEVFHMVGVFEGTHLQTEEVDKTKIDPNQDETRVDANFVYTKDPEVTMVIRPADCPVSILYAKDKDQKDILGFIHSSGLSTNAGIPRHAIRHLVDTLGVEPSTITIGIVPGILKDHYAMSEEADIIKNPNLDKVIVERNWKDHIDPKSTVLDDYQRRHVDILGATIMQFIEEGVNPQNIQAYEVDTWEAQKNGIAFSNRYSAETGETQGRFMVAAQLKST